MNKYKNILLIVAFFCFTFSVLILYLVMPKKETSYFEKRTLATLPEYSVETLLSGELFKEYETYFADHFPKRDGFVKLYKQYEIASPSTFVGGYHITKDNWILAKPIVAPDYPATVEGAELVNQFAQEMKEKGIEVKYISLPAKMNVISIPHPKYIDKDLGLEQKKVFFDALSAEVDSLDVLDKFKSKYSQEEINNMYFKTDHHWDHDGAYAGYKEIVKFLDVDDDKRSENYEKTCMNDSVFTGSWNLQLYELVDASTEEVCAYFPTEENTNFYNSALYNTIETSVKKPWDTFYAEGFVNIKEKIAYSQIFTNDFKIFRVFNESNKGKDNVLILKDSYTNPLFPLLSNHFYETTIFDLRHSDEGELTKLINDNNYDLILIMYNETFLYGPMYNFK